MAIVLGLLAALALAHLVQGQSIIIDHHHHHQRHRSQPNSTHSEQQPVGRQQQPHLARHFQPASLLLAQNKSINFTHVAVDELTGTIYLGATNWLFQVNGRDLRLEQALRTGPTTSESSSARDCAPAECPNQLVQVDPEQLTPLVLHHQHGGSSAIDLLALAGGPTSGLGHPAAGQAKRFLSSATMHTGSGANLTAGRRASGQSAGGRELATTTTTTQLPATTQTTSSPATSTQNNYNKILAIDHESRHLIVCGSLNQGACRRHQLGNLANFSELVPLPVASNDEHSSTVALIGRPQTTAHGQQVHTRRGGGGGGQTGSQQQPGVMYVAATNSRLGPYREMVPAISARSLDWSSRDRSMQIIERSFTDLARVDISFELRDYYLVNYVYAFQHNEFVYFATVQRKSPLRQLEEWGYSTRLARLCLSDLSFQSYTEMTLECSTGGSGSPNAGGGGGGASSKHRGVNYNLLQDAHLMQAGSQLQQQVGGRGHTGRGSSAVLVGAFAQSKDHTTRSQQRSALCLFSMDEIERRFEENIDLCYNGTIKSRNMNYIAGSVNDCPRGSSSSASGPSGPNSQTSSANYCNEPIKLNGSLALAAEPIASFDQELITSVSSTLAPTSPVNIQPQAGPGASQSQRQAQLNSVRQHQVLVVGTSEGRLKRLVLVPTGQHRTAALEFDSISLVGNGGVGGGGGNGASASGTTANAGESQVTQVSDSAVLADMHMLPAVNPQLSAHHAHGTDRHQFVLAATSHKLVKLRVNSCKASAAAASHRATVAGNNRQFLPTAGNNSSIVDDCLACSQLQDPFCGWCSNSAACTTRDECLQEHWNVPSNQAHSNTNQLQAIHWTPFDSIRCSNYQPISPKNVPLQADSTSSLVDVNVRLNLRQQQTAPLEQGHNQLAARLAQAQFVCHFDYLSLWNRSLVDSTSGGRATNNLAGATTKATQARLNLHAGTVAIGCPLPVASQRPVLGAAGSDQARVRLSVRLDSVGGVAPGPYEDRLLIERVLGMRGGGTSSSGSGHTVAGSSPSSSSIEQSQQAPGDPIERELTLYDCSLNSDCRSCLSSGSLGRRWSCAWCPLSNKCTFNSSHPDFGCAASAVASTTPHSAQIRGSQLTASLDRAQASVLGLTLDRLSQCPKSTGASPSEPEADLAAAAAATTTGLNATGDHHLPERRQQVEILVPNQVRRSLQVSLARPIQHFQPREKRVLKLECLLELEGAKARFAARLVDNSNVICQEALLSYQAELATQRAQLSVILNDLQVIETTEVILYKCHLFGVNPPALASSLANLAELGPERAREARHLHHSSASWPGAGDLLDLIPSADGSSSSQSQSQSATLLANGRRGASDCSLCLNIERKFQCAWCAGQCKFADHCQELPASTCPPPRIDSIHPTAGPIEGGTLLTIEGSNLGSNEREIQDKILVGGEPCQLVMYSVSTRIVCRTGPSSSGGPQAATVFVGNRAGVTSAYEKFHYKAVHLSDVNPRIGPVSGGTRLFLSGANLNIGSRLQVHLDDIPCALDSSFEASPNQIACVTGPNLLASSSMRIARLTLAIDNSSHQLPYPFAYQPDPIITQIEPAESFLSGGRLVLVSGQHLASPQTTKLVVFHESRPSLSNATSCVRQNDTLVTCLTPAFSRADLLAVQQVDDSPPPPPPPAELDQQARVGGQSSALSHEAGGLKLKLAFIMDDVRSVRNLDEYYHHLPHYITYFEDPQLFRMEPPVLEYRPGEELHLAGENLLLRQLDQDMLITIGAHICPIKSIHSNRVVCEPPARIAPIYQEHHAHQQQHSEPLGFFPAPSSSATSTTRRKPPALVERPLLPVVALIGSNLRYELGHMQYSASQYSTGEAAAPGSGLPPAQLAPPSPNYPQDFSLDSAGGSFAPGQPSPSQEATRGSAANFATAIGLLLFGLLSALLLAGLMLFLMARFRHSKAQQREYKRIQLQMGSLECHSPGLGGLGGGSFASSLFDKIYLPSLGAAGNQQAGQQTINQQQLFANQQHRQQVDYAAGNHLTAGAKSKPLYQFFTGGGQPQVPSSFPPSPLTDISSLVGSSPAHQQQQQQQQQQHVVKLNAGGQVVSVANQQQQQYNYGLSPGQAGHPQNSASPSHSSSGSSSGGSARQNHLQAAGRNRFQPHQQRGQQNNSSARNFNWTQEAPSTIVPYAVIEACNLTLEGKNAIKDYV